MPKRLIICCDGTWNRVDQPYSTNVVKMARAITPRTQDGQHQVVYYGQGVGTRWGLDRLTGGVLGHGLDKNVEDAYLFLLHNYEEGDELYLFGFSRGAYTVRSLGGLLRNCGLLRKLHADRFRAAMDLYRSKEAHPESEEALDFRATYSREMEVHFMGVWDTVGALGIPIEGLRFLTKDRYEFHDVELSSRVRNAYQAVSIDERRGPFKPSLWMNKPKPGQTIEQVWFAGVHTDVGGGNVDSGSSDVAFMWMKAKAEACGLVFDEEYIRTAIRPEPVGRLHESLSGLYRLFRRHVRSIGDNRWANQAVHPAVVERYDTDETYRPENLRAYLERSDREVARVP